MASAEKDRLYLGYLVVGFLSLVGGIAVFVLIVIPQRQPETGVPRDVQVRFTELYSNQGLVRSETGRYTPALITLGIDQNDCRTYSCLLTVAPDGQAYQFRLSREGKTWMIDQKSPVPKEIL